MQYLISLFMVIITSLICFFASDLLGYKTTALILLMVVSILAMLFDIRPVLLSAFLSALIWNFFFIPPVFTFHIGNTEDMLMFSLYFAIAMVNAVLTIKIRQAESVARDKEEKEKTIKLYNTLLNSLSHELRTPIATIIGSVDTLKDHRPNLNSQQEEELLDQIDQASLRLNRQVENLLSMNRLESGMLMPRTDWCDLNELVQSEIRRCGKEDQDRIQFSPDEDLPFFKIDSGLTEQILYNLIHNALLYSPSDKPVSIKCAAVDHACVILVEDSGHGIPEEHHGSVFNKFFRLPKTTPGGSGLGLSIVKGFVEAMNGSVELTNLSTGGAQFRVIIPAETNYMNQLKNE